MGRYWEIIVGYIVFIIVVFAYNSFLIYEGKLDEVIDLSNIKIITLIVFVMAIILDFLYYHLITKRDNATMEV